MNKKKSNQRLYALLMILGAGILLFRTIRMMFVENAFEVLVLWVNLLLIAEFLIDSGCILSSINWFITNDRSKARLPLWFGAAATILHALRVLIYVIGRTGPWVNFDVKPEYHDSYTFDPFWVYFAAILSALGIIGLIIIWRIIRRKKAQTRS